MHTLTLDITKLFFQEELDTLITTLNGLPGSHSMSRSDALIAFRRFLGRTQGTIREQFESQNLTGSQAAKKLAAMMDQLLVALSDYSRIGFRADHPNVDFDQIVITATGGYGYGMLAPFSDVDLLFITPDSPSEPLFDFIHFILYFLWDLGLKIGHATRTIKECAAAAIEDVSIHTALLDARYLTGNKRNFNKFRKSFFDATNASGTASFIAGKQIERQRRHERYGDTPYLVEPNIKEGRGGLRDMQTLYWMCRHQFGETLSVEDPLAPRLATLGYITEKEARNARRSWNFLWTVRLHLHYVAGRGEERLTFDMQPVVGGRMGYTRHGQQIGVERFMRHYFLNVREITRLTYVLEPAIIRHALGPPALSDVPNIAMYKAGFTLSDNNVLPLPHVSFRDNPIYMLRLMQWAKKCGRPIHPLAIREMIRWEKTAIKLRGQKEMMSIFMNLLCGPLSSNIQYKTELSDTTPKTHNKIKNRNLPQLSFAHAPPIPRDNVYWLHLMNDTGILGQLIPGWKLIVGQIQFNTYHIYAVDEHTIEAIRYLTSLEAGENFEGLPLINQLIHSVQSRRALYMAVLLHDIAKGRHGDHSDLGADLAQKICPLFGMTSEESETTSWLVLHHLLLTHTAFQRDIDDPKTILDLAEIVQSPERLRLLLLLTVVDMHAVNPKIWNAWKATLLRELYTRVSEVLAGGLTIAERDYRVDESKRNTSRKLAEQGFTKSEIEFFLSLGYGGYWLAFDEEMQIHHAWLIRQAVHENSDLVVDIQPLPTRGVTEITVYTKDRVGLFSVLSGAMAVAGASIVDGRIHTMSNGMVLDTFWVQDTAHEAFEEPRRLEKMRKLISESINNQFDLPKAISKIHHSNKSHRMRAIHVPPRIVFDNQASTTHTIIEVNGRDRAGLLYDITLAISMENLQISSAHITTYGVRAVDVFYVKDLFGLKIQDPVRLNNIHKILLKVLEHEDN